MLKTVVEKGKGVPDKNILLDFTYLLRPDMMPSNEEILYYNVIDRDM